MWREICSRRVRCRLARIWDRPPLSQAKSRFVETVTLYYAGVAAFVAIGWSPLAMECSNVGLLAAGWLFSK